MNLSNLKMSTLVKIAAAVGIAAVVIMQAITSNREDKLEKISDAILTLEQKVSTELEAVEKEEKAKAAPSVSPSASATPSK
jgi:cytoskeletal protein RodZ